ncbi:MAG: GDP-mannose 4,6-dehydratase [Proteobacteria bacterium]|nr:GDP-mannose 4,6-dehydratase [Pseudomonadota bacterium]
MTKTKTALITGVTGQDGSYLAELLLGKGYHVHGIVRRNSDFTSKRIDHLLTRPDFVTSYGDVVDSSSLHSLLVEVKPVEIYHLAAQSHVGVSFQIPDYSAQVNALGTLRLLNAIKELKLDCRFYQASTSELFGGLPETAPQSESTPFTPRSPYAIGKLFSYWSVRNYREAYGLHASNGIFFNHESPRRGKNFVTKKISQAVARIKQGTQDNLRLGNLDAERDWGYAREYVEAMWLMLQQPQPNDLVVGTGVRTSVRRFTELCFAEIGIVLEWSGKGVSEVGRDKKTGKTLVSVDPVYFRATEADLLQADPRRANEKLKWKPKTDVAKLAQLMLRYDLAHEDYGFPDEA